MLHALAKARSTRQVLWLHAARDGKHHPFAAEVRRLTVGLLHARSYVSYSRPGPGDRIREDFTAAGRLSQSIFNELDVPRDGDVYLCGPARFMADMKESLANYGVPPQRLHSEIFNGSESRMPGVTSSPKRIPHLPDEDDTQTGPLVSFDRSGITAHWVPSAYQSILELAEACDIPVRWSCRTGVCHSCESGLVSGAVAYAPQPLDEPAAGNVLLCCSQPTGDVVIDL
jgi:ferredoxin-NADP reductase